MAGEQAFAASTGSLPWEPDRALTIDAAAAAIRASFPTIESEGLKHLGSGWEFDAFVTTDGWVFRFPRRADCAKLFDAERRVHQLVSAVLPATVAVPHVELVGQPSPGFPYSFAGHRFIAGVDADAVDSRLMSTLARDIAAALGAIHSIPETTARDAGVLARDLDDVGGNEWLERGLAAASELRGLDPIVDQAVSWVRRTSLPLARFDGPLRLVHQDLSPEHVIVDAATGQVTGILDWTDTILGDPARDFVFLVTWRGWDFAEEVLRSYPHAVDRDFRGRLQFMARLLSVMWLAMAHVQHGNTAIHIEWVRNAFAPVARR
jgi:aminoglycoside phosphotransferase (APT) family kinase protein